MNGSVGVVVNVGVVLVDGQVIARVTVVGDQGSALVVAGKLHSVWVQLVNWGQESLVVIDNNGVLRVVGSRCKLRAVLRGDLIG